jgi:hypothetical protein
MAVILYTDGSSKDVRPENGNYFEVEELMAIVEGPVQMIPMADGRIMTFIEEGGPDAESGRAGLPPNEEATKLAGFQSSEGPLGALRGFGVGMPGYAVGPGGLAYIPGTVVVSTKEEVQWEE